MLHMIMVGISIMVLQTGCFATNAIMFDTHGSSADSRAAAGILGLSESAHAIFQNPALLGSDYSVAVDVFHTRLLEEADFNALSVAKSIGKTSLGILQY